MKWHQDLNLLLETDEGCASGAFVVRAQFDRDVLAVLERQPPVALRIIGDVREKKHSRVIEAMSDPDNRPAIESAALANLIDAGLYFRREGAKALLGAIATGGGTGYFAA